MDFTPELTLHGHTQASRKVALKAEVNGRVIDTPVEKGAQVAKGAVICALDRRARDQELAEARARLQQRRLEYEAAKKLAAAGRPWPRRKQPMRRRRRRFGARSWISPTPVFGHRSMGWWPIGPLRSATI